MEKEKIGKTTDCKVERFGRGETRKRRKDKN